MNERNEQKYLPTTIRDSSVTMDSDTVRREQAAGSIFVTFFAAVTDFPACGQIASHVSRVTSGGHVTRDT